MSGIVIVPQLIQFPFEPLEGCAMAILTDQVCMEVHVWVTELVIIGGFVVHYSSRRLFDLQFEKFLFRQLFPDGRRHFRY